MLRKSVLKPHKLMDCFAEELALRKAFSEPFDEPKPKWFNLLSYIKSLIQKNRFRMEIGDLPHVAAESFAVEARCALVDPDEGIVELPFIGSFKRVFDEKNDVYTAEFSASESLKAGKRIVSLNNATQKTVIDGFVLIEDAAKRYLEKAVRSDKKLENLSMPDLLGDMCSAISGKLSEGYTVDLNAIGILAPDLTFLPDGGLLHYFHGMRSSARGYDKK